MVLGSHLDSVPNGGWLDGALGMMAGLEALRLYRDQRPPVTLAAVAALSLGTFAFPLATVLYPHALVSALASERSGR